ncbi:MAG: dATP pyrophosphohydrolase [Micavibrio sp.]|nr:dATP pyrophosphohydrolase [Micavibrio sp.]HCK33395.1 dATP pyrophosphohydrolase [Rhodospirillaceae bacterium]
MAEFEIIFAFAVLFCVFIAFMKEVVGPHIVAMTGMMALLLAGIINTEDVLSVFSNSAPATIACMFIISAALDRTGVIDYIGQTLLKLSNKSAVTGIFALLIFVMVVSAFMNNTPVVIILAPVVIRLAESMKQYPSRFLIPLSYTAIMGGACTLIGTSTNILVDGVAQAHGMPAMQMFEITGPGMLMAAAGISFMALMGRFLLPERMPPKDQVDEEVQRKRFVAEAIIPVDSLLIGKTLNEVQFTQGEDYEIIDLIRKDRGNRYGLNDALAALLSNFKKDEEDIPSTAPKSVSHLRNIPLEAGDILVFKLAKDELVELSKHIGVDFDPQRAHFSDALPTRSVTISEGVIGPNSNLIGRQLKNVRFRYRYRCFAIAIHRNEKNISSDLGSVVLKEGDTLVLEGEEDDLQRLFETEGLLNSTQIRQVSFSLTKAIISVATIIGVVVLSALGIMPIAGLAFIGAMAVILSGCVTPEQAYKAIEWKILMLIFGMLGIGMAMEKSGAMELLVTTAVQYIEPLGPVVILGIVYLLTSFLTEIITNNAVAIVMTPIVIGMAHTLGLDPKPFIVAVMMAASASFATPIGYQTNTFVYAAGGYKFTDFLRVGVPMNIIMWIVAMLVIPLFWSF